jgi:hypothetical protein
VEFACILRFARLRVTVVMVTLGTLLATGDQTRTISNAEVVLSHSWRLSRCPACVLCSLRLCTIHYRIQLTAFGCASHHTGTVSHVVSRGCAPGEQMDSVCKH